MNSNISQNILPKLNELRYTNSFLIILLWVNNWIIFGFNFYFPEEMLWEIQQSWHLNETEHGCAQNTFPGFRLSLNSTKSSISLIYHPCETSVPWLLCPCNFLRTKARLFRKFPVTRRLRYVYNHFLYLKHSRSFMAVCENVIKAPSLNLSK